MKALSLEPLPGQPLRGRASRIVHSSLHQAEHLRLLKVFVRVLALGRRGTDSTFRQSSSVREFQELFVLA